MDVLGKELKVGFVAHYIRDYDFKHLMEINGDTALELVKYKVPHIKIDSKRTFGEITLDGWTTKAFVIISCEHDVFIAVSRHDDRFHLYTKVI